MAGRVALSRGGQTPLVAPGPRLLPVGAGRQRLQALYDYCADAFQAMVFISGLSDAYGEYKARLENAQAKGVDLHPKRLDLAKDRAARHQPAARAPAPYAGNPIAMAFATTGNGGHPGHSLQGGMPLFNKDGTFNCFICKQEGHKARECPRKKTFDAGPYKPGATATTNTTTGGTTAAPAPAPPAPAPGPATSPAGPQPGVPLSLILSAAPPASGAASAVSAFTTNTTRGALGQSRTINNQELVELLRSTQDNGDSTSTLLLCHHVGHATRGRAPGR